MKTLIVLTIVLFSFGSISPARAPLSPDAQDKGVVASERLAASDEECRPLFNRIAITDQAELQSLAKALQTTLMQTQSGVDGLANHLIVDVYGSHNWAILEVAFLPATETDVIWLFPAEKIGANWLVYCPGSSGATRVISRIPVGFSPFAGLKPNDWRLITPAFLMTIEQLRDAKEALTQVNSYRLPYANGITVSITQDSAHHGGPVDMVGQGTGKTIVAAADGWVRAIEESHNECCYSSSCDTCNNYIVMEHANNEWTKYLHVQQNSVVVGVGAYIAAGTVLAIEGDVGNTRGNSGRSPVPCNGVIGSGTYCGRHLHFQLHVGGRYGTIVEPYFCNIGFVVQGQAYAASACNGPTPTNDQCSGAIALSTGVARADNTATATSTSDPIPTCEANFGKGVWYTFTPSTSGTITISTCGSNFDTVLQVYTGNCAALMSVSGGCNDDDGPDCSGLDASASFSGAAGTTYRILAGGYNSQSGSLNIVARINSQPFPPFFNGHSPLGNSWYWLRFPSSNNYFGYYNLASFPWLNHLDMGWEYAVDANNGGGVFLYDWSSNTWFYTSPLAPFPYLYDYSLQTWLYYSPISGYSDRFTSNPRWFFNLTTQQWFNK